MTEVKDIGTVIASREMTFVFADGSKEVAMLKVGQPVEVGGGLDWCCPFELNIGTMKRLRGIHGIDAVQALDLTMKSLRTDIEYLERTKGGKFHFLDEEGAGV
jgi:hypothetical protein